MVVLYQGVQNKKEWRAIQLYNYIISKIDTIVVDMEDSSISLVDMLVKYSK